MRTPAWQGLFISLFRKGRISLSTRTETVQRAINIRSLAPIPQFFFSSLESVGKSEKCGNDPFMREVQGKLLKFIPRQTRIYRTETACPDHKDRISEHLSGSRSPPSPPEKHKSVKTDRPGQSLAGCFFTVFRTGMVWGSLECRSATPQNAGGVRWNRRYCPHIR